MYKYYRKLKQHFERLVSLNAAKKKPYKLMVFNTFLLEEENYESIYFL